MNCQFSETFFVTCNIYSKLSVKEGQICGLKIAEAVDITVGDHFYICLNNIVI